MRAPDEAFRMATIQGARALGLETQFGSLEAGKRADFVVLQLGSGVFDPIEACVINGRVMDIQHTFVGGKEAVVDLEGLRAEVENIRRELV